MIKALIIFALFNWSYSASIYCSDKINAELCEKYNQTNFDSFNFDILNRPEIDSLNFSIFYGYREGNIDSLLTLPSDELLLKYEYLNGIRERTKRHSPVYDPYFNAFMSSFSVVTVLFLSELIFMPYTKKYDINKVGLMAGISMAVTLPIFMLQARKDYKVEQRINIKPMNFPRFDRLLFR